jgi:hypothetical protein
LKFHTLHKVKMYVAAVNGYLLAASATVTAVAGMISFAPAVRRTVLRFFRRRKRKIAELKVEGK